MIMRYMSAVFTAMHEIKRKTCVVRRIPATATTTQTSCIHHHDKHGGGGCKRGTATTGNSTRYTVD